MFFLAAGAIAAGAAVGAGLVASSRATARLRLRFAPDETHWARTEDGWELPLGRYLPRGTRVAREPVILCHGMGANRFNLDLNERYSVARYLAARGFETWVVELRACGMSKRCTPGARYAHRFDDEVRHDIPALIGKVREVSGAERVLWVGHSKGGMVIYGWCALAVREDLAGAVTIGSPMRIAPRLPPALIETLLRLDRVPLLDAIYVEQIFRTLAPLGPRVQLQYMASRKNMDPEIVSLLMANLLGNVPTNVLRQFSLWARTKRFTSWDGSVDYEAGLASSPVPFLLIAGADDRLVPPATVEVARDAMKAAKVEYVLAGRAQGFQCDYGHGDLVLGRCAPDEIFPIVERWLSRHATRP